MAGTAASFSGRSGYSLHTEAWESSTNPSANQSTFYAQIYIYADNVAYKPYDLGGSSYWYYYVGGNGPAGYYNYDFRSWAVGYTQTLWSGYYTFNHASDGTVSIWCDGYSTAASPLGTADPGGFTTYGTTFTGPSAPSAAPTLTRSSPYSSIGISSATPSSVGSLAVQRYDYDYNTDNATWGNNITSMGNSTTATKSSLTPTTGYWFRTRAVSNQSNNWGIGAWSSSTFKAGIPSAPSSISASRTGRNVTVTCGTPSTNGGATISGYYVQYSTDDGSTWSTAQAMTSQSYTYTNLTASLTYKFRCYAVNSTGSDATNYSILSDSLFVPAGGKRFNGTSFSSTNTAKRYATSSWVDISNAKRYNAATNQWVDLS